MSTRTTTTATTVAKQKETKKPSSKSPKKKAVELGDLLVLPSFANNEYQTQYSQIVRSERKTSLVKKATWINYGISLFLFLLGIIFTIYANKSIRGM